MTTNNQTKCDTIYEKIAMRAGDDERMINYEQPYYSLERKGLVMVSVVKYIQSHSRSPKNEK